MTREQNIIRAANACRLHIHPSCDDPDLRELLRLDVESLLALPNAKAVRDTSHALLVRIERAQGRPALYWKEFRPRCRMDTIKEFFRRSKAARAWQGSLDLQRIRLRTARLVAYGEAPRRSPFRMGRSFIVTEEVADAVNLLAFLLNFPSQPSVRELSRKRMILREVGRAAGRMHEGGLYHGDLRLGNILLRFGGEERPELYFVDTDRVLRRRLPGNRAAVHNLMQIMFLFVPGVTLSDRLRIVEAYAWERALGRTAARRLAKSTCAWVQRRVRRRLRIAVIERDPREPVAEMQRLLQGIEALRRT